MEHLETPDNSFNETHVEFFNQNQAYLNALSATTTGMYRGRVPQDVDLSLGVFHECKAGNQTEEVGVLSDENENLELIVVETEMENIAIQGSIRDCNGGVQDHVFVKVSFEDKQYLYLTDELGDFNYNFANCDDAEVSITAIDDINKKVSDVINLATSNQINAGEIETCGDIIAGYEIDYEQMDWKEALANSTNHTWSISRISGSNPRTIFSSTMVDKDTEVSYLQSAFVIREDLSDVDFQISFLTQGFLVIGKCEVEIEEYNGLTAYRFIGTGDDIGVTDDVIYPQENVDLVNFDLVYYD